MAGWLAGWRGLFGKFHESKCAWGGIGMRFGIGLGWGWTLDASHRACHVCLSLISRISAHPSLPSPGISYSSTTTAAALGFSCVSVPLAGSAAEAWVSVGSGSPCLVMSWLGWAGFNRQEHLTTPLSSLAPRFVFFTCAGSAERLVYEHSRTDHGQKSPSKGPCCDSKGGVQGGKTMGRWRVPPPQKVPADSMVGAWWCGFGVRVCVRCGVRVSRRQNLRPACLDAINLQCHPWRESRPPRPTGDPSGSCGVGGSITSLCGVTGGRTAAAAAAMLLPRCKGKPGKPG